MAAALPTPTTPLRERLLSRLRPLRQGLVLQYPPQLPVLVVVVVAVAVAVAVVVVVVVVVEVEVEVAVDSEVVKAVDAVAAP